MKKKLFREMLCHLTPSTVIAIVHDLRIAEKLGWSDVSLVPTPELKKLRQQAEKFLRKEHEGY